MMAKCWPMLTKFGPDVASVGKELAEFGSDMVMVAFRRGEEGR